MPQTPSRKDAPQAVADLDLKLLEASTAVAAVVVALDGRIVAANARMRRLLGIGDLGSAPLLVDYFTDATVWESWRDVPRAGRAVELELRGCDGTARLLRGDLLLQGEGAG